MRTINDKKTDFFSDTRPCANRFMTFTDVYLNAMDKHLDTDLSASFQRK